MKSTVSYILVDNAYYEIIIKRIILDINAFLLTCIKKTILYQSSIQTVKKDDRQNLYKLYMVLMAVKVMCLCLAQDTLSDSIYPRLWIVITKSRNSSYITKYD